MKKASTILAIFFFSTTVVLIYLFVFKGKVADVAEDRRIVIELS